MRPFNLLPAVLGLLLATSTAVAGGDFHRDRDRRPDSGFGFFLKLDDGRGYFHHQGYRFHRPSHFRHGRDRHDGRRFHGGRDFRHGDHRKDPRPHWKRSAPRWKHGGPHWKRGGRHWDRHRPGHRRDRPARLRFRYD